MATDDLTYGGTVTRLLSENARPAFVRLERTIDFSVAANSVSNADVLQVVAIPAGMFVMRTPFSFPGPGEGQGLRPIGGRALLIPSGSVIAFFHRGRRATVFLKMKQGR